MAGAGKWSELHREELREGVEPLDFFGWSREGSRDMDKKKKEEMLPRDTWRKFWVQILREGKGRIMPPQTCQIK